MDSLSSWVVGNLILDEAEVLWLVSCLAASGALSDGGNNTSKPLDRLAIQLMQRSFNREDADLVTPWSLRRAAFEHWRGKQSKPPSQEEDHYAEGALLVALGVNLKQRKPRAGVTKKIRERIEREAVAVVAEIQTRWPGEPPTEQGS